MVNDRSSSAQVKKNNRAEEWLKNAVKDKHVRLIPFSEISKVKYNVAKGGSGTIHLGAWRNMHVAIKEQHNTSDLIKELKMHKQVHDSNYIVKFFGITKHPLTQDTCIVMQFAENGCLQDYLEMQNVSIAWHTKYRLAWEIASGLDFIHRENIFHTDLHSRNILIDTDGKALITDFGLSKSVNKTIYTTKAGLFGVVPYVAPERMQNPTITYTAKCDIYSLGVILWELSSCMIPFESQLQDVMLAVNIIAGVREKTVAGTAVEYEMLYRRCWDGLPQNRPQMEIVLSELVELLAAEQLNPRTAESRPRSPRQRPLSSDSMVAPSTYDNDVALQSSPENSTHVRPASLLRPSVRQSFAQGMAPLMQGIPAVPIRQDRSGVRVSFLGEPIAKDSYTNGFQRANGVSDTGKPGGAKPTQRNTIIAQDGDEIGGSDSYNYGAGNTSVKTAQEGGQRAGLDSPVIHDTIPRGTIEPNASKSTDASASPAKEASPERPKETKDKATARAIGSDTSTPGRTSSSENPTDSPPSNQFLPPIPTFNTLSLASHFPSDIESTPTSNSPPLEPGVNKLPETAALALASGLSMTRVVSKLKLGSVKNIPTISPPPSGAPPPPPMAAAGHSNSPRVISPSSSHRAKIVSPPLRNGQVRASKTISPPPGPPPGPPLSRAFVPKPPPGPPPSTTPQQLGDALTGKGHDNTSSKTLKSECRSTA
ncbi:hypothetical protein BGW38_000500 [Lunasporangiospora selenospora]|uniref:Protein kinase domain-containing protein n=1 Tax=Lunasporangiospora selenospora TaxID=979761 RepID=A0A9P6FW08_9FUNG|nr:hypothetical protein BGW38_000500 [Lunasporangiospora selenospora]